MVTQLDTLPMISLMSDVVRLRFEDVGVDFPTAAGPMRVVDGVDLEVRAGRVRLDHRPVGLRQDDAAQHRRRLRQADARPGPARPQPVKGPAPIAA